MDIPFEAQSRQHLHGINYLQNLNYMDHAIDSNKYFIKFFERYVFVFLKNYPIAVKKSPDISPAISSQQISGKIV